jgi:Zn-dependent protease with chaperone function
MTGPVLTIGATPPQLVSFADYFDGHRAVPQRVGLRVDEAPGGAILHLDLPGGGTVRWPLDEMRGIPDQADRGLLAAAWTADPVARIIVTDPETQAILRARCLNLGRRPPVKGKGKLLTWALAAVASVALIVFVLVPVMADQLAEYMPPAGEQALGDSTLEQIRGALSENRFLPMAFCERPAGTAALATMTAALTEGLNLPYEIKVHVLDGDIVNAFALPGGHVVFFRGLIDAAERPEEVAAVYAHELGHVVHRDPTRSALRSAGSIGVLGLLLGDFAGGTVVLFITERLIDATYSQRAEAEADAFAHARMIAAGLRPDALASMFERLRAKYGDSDDGFLKHFAAHPTLGNRIEAARRASAGLETAPKDLLSPEAWQDLKAICG